MSISGEAGVFLDRSWLEDNTSFLLAARGADTVLWSRGEVRRLRVAVKISFALFFVAVVDWEGTEVALGDLGASGRRTLGFGGVLPEDSSALFCVFGNTGRCGDDSVRSNVSISSTVGWVCRRVGDDFLKTDSSLNFLGVVDDRHISSVDCFEFPQDEATEVARTVLPEEATFGSPFFASWL